MQITYREAREVVQSGAYIIASHGNKEIRVTTIENACYRQRFYLVTDRASDYAQTYDFLLEAVNDYNDR